MPDSKLYVPFTNRSHCSQGNGQDPLPGWGCVPHLVCPCVFNQKPPPKRQFSEEQGWECGERGRGFGTSLKGKSKRNSSSRGMSGVCVFGLFVYFLQQAFTVFKLRINS